MLNKFEVFVLGGAIGAAAALMFAPRPGDETRAIVTDWIANSQLGATGIPDRVYKVGQVVAHDASHAGQYVAENASVVADAARTQFSDVAGQVTERVSGVASQAQGAAAVSVPVVNERSEELRSKIEEARSRIASQIASNATEAVAPVEEAVVETAEVSAEPTQE